MAGAASGAVGGFRYWAEINTSLFMCNDSPLIHASPKEPQPTMSDLQRALAKLSTYPAGPPPELDGEDEAEVNEETDQFGELPQHDDDSSSASSASSASSTGTIIPSQNQKLFARPQGSASS